MAEPKLIPGFRFHPTDVELVMYFLKRKIMGRKFPVDVITELDIYKYAPWDLPDKSLLKSGDLKWYFFSPTGKKYSIGGRMNRATEIGYWKTTGKDRSIQHNNQLVGMIRTLVFHIGKAPKGDRTDWVMHEFRLDDKYLADQGIPQSSYVICRVFQKEGPGPRNAAQYGKPFNEKDWDSEEEFDCVQAVPVAVVSAPVPILPSSSYISATNDMHPSASGCIGPTPVSCLSRLMPSGLAQPSAPSNQVDNGILSLLSIFKEDNTLARNENNESEKVGSPGQANNAEGAPYLDPNEIFGELGDLHSLVGLDEGGGFSYGQKIEYTKNEMLSTDNVALFHDPHDFVELNDLEVPEQTKDDGSWGQDKQA
ncbi:NAC domain-containing protein 82-like isoform X1 [Trifolium pratense]|uniref:NAC domain-containing protein 82-like isoform X1 n=2 Tax=Trifolium pratense TaxID=57577 RepID=UPI001E6902B0|nr:NAC domain-containing protein 82-like isoform X1 [Trifolium pratense]